MWIGCCVRDAGGDLIQASSVYKSIFVSILVAELLVIGEGLPLAIDFGASKIIVQSDCKGAIDLIFSPYPWLNEFGNVLGIIFDFSKRAEIFLFFFVPRNCNKLAHDLARHVLVCLFLES